MTRPAKPQAWTAEPWEIEDGYPECIVVSGSRLLEVCGRDTDSTKDFATAARIVSCVNAMAGIPDPAAYRAAVKRLLAAIDDAGWLGHAIREAEFALLDIEDPSEENSDD